MRTSIEHVERLAVQAQSRFVEMHPNSLAEPWDPVRGGLLTEAAPGGVD
jgi:hypothetical protein